MENKIRSSNLGIRERLFFFLYFVYGFKTLLILIPLDDPLVVMTRNIINSLLFVVMGVSFFYIPNKARLLIILFSIVFAYNIVISGNNGLYNYLILFVVLGLTISLDLKYILTVILSTNIILFLIILPFIFIAGQFFMIDLRYNDERFTLGFGSPNTMSQYLLMLYLSLSLYTYRYTTGKGVFFLTTTIAFSFFFVLIYLSISRTGLALLSMAFLGMIAFGLIKESDGNNKKIKIIYIISMLAICLIQIYTMLNYPTGGVYTVLNGVLSGRLSMSSYMYLITGYIPLVNGINIEPFLPIDFNFIKMIFSIGIIVSIIFFVIYIKQFNKKRYSPIGVVILFVGLASSFTESYFAVFFLNISILMVYSKSEYC